MKEKVSYETAVFFYDQICGQYNGHMSKIPNNPVLYGLMEANGIHNAKSFAEFLRGVADQLDDIKF